MISRYWKQFLIITERSQTNFNKKFILTFITFSDTECQSSSNKDSGKYEWTHPDHANMHKRSRLNGLIKDNTFVQNSSFRYSVNLFTAGVTDLRKGSSSSIMSLNKFPVWHICGNIADRPIWFPGRTDLQTICVKISWRAWNFVGWLTWERQQQHGTIGSTEDINQEKTATHANEKGTISPSQSKFALWFASEPIVAARFGSLGILSFCRMLQRKKMWLEWRSRYWNVGTM